MNTNITVAKTYGFAIKIIAIYQNLKLKKEFDFARQILRCGTSIGANVQEAQSAESSKDFVHKISISLKEAKETYYWLSLIKDSLILESKYVNPLKKENEEIIKILSQIILTMKSKQI